MNTMAETLTMLHQTHAQVMTEYPGMTPHQSWLETRRRCVDVMLAAMA
jgi:hypothetical protein